MKRLNPDSTEGIEEKPFLIPAEVDTVARRYISKEINFRECEANLSTELVMIMIQIRRNMFQLKGTHILPLPPEEKEKIGGQLEIWQAKEHGTEFVQNLLRRQTNTTVLLLLLDRFGSEEI